LQWPVLGSHWYGVGVKRKKPEREREAAKKQAIVYVGSFPNQDAADRAAKKISDAGLLTITRQDGVEVWTVRKPTIS
jgi:hypothetical protein